LSEKEMQRARDAALRNKGAATETPPPPPAAERPSATPPTAAAADGDDLSTRLYRKLKEQDDEQRNKVKATSFDLNDARSKLDKILSPKKVNGTGDIKVSVGATRTRQGASSVLKKIPLRRMTQGEKAAEGPSQPSAATGESHDPNLDS